MSRNIENRNYPSLESIIHEEIQLYTQNRADLMSLIINCSILRWFDEELIALLAPEGAETPRDLFEKLKLLPLCKQHPIRGYSLDDNLRDYLLESVDVMPRIPEFHTRAAEAYHQRLLSILDEGLPPMPAKWFDHPDWKVFAAEWLYHMAWVDPDLALQQLMHIFAEAFAVLVSARKEVEFCYELFNRINFDQLGWPDGSQYKKKILYLGEKLRILLAYQDKDALDLLEELAATPDLTAEQRASLYQWIGSTCFREIHQLARAKERLETAYKLNPNDWLINAELSAFHMSFGLLWGRMDLAREYAENAVRSDERIDRGFIELGNICQILSDWEGAIQCYESAKTVDPQSIDALLGLSEVYGARRLSASDVLSNDVGDVEWAIKLIEQAEEISPDIHNYALIRKGNVYRGANRFVDACKAYETAISEKPDRSDAYIELGRLYKAQSQFRQAEEKYRKAINENELEAIGYYEVAVLLEIQGKYERAIEECKKAQENKGIKSFQLYWELSDLYKSLGRWEEMETSWKKWVEYDPGSAYIAHCLMGDAYQEQAWKQRSPEEVQEFARRAQAEYEKALEIDASLAGAHVALAELAILQIDSAKYSEHLRFVEDLSPWAVYDMLVRLGRAKLGMRLSGEAKDLLTKAVGIAPQRNEARFALGDLYRGESNEEKFLQTWDEIVRIDPTFRYSRHLNLGDFYNEQFAYDQARSQYNEAINSNPDLAEAYLHLAYLSKAERKQDEAIGHFTAAKDRASAYDSEALAEISTIHLNNNNFNEAESVARKAIFSDPELIYGYRALVQLGVKSDNQEFVGEARKLLASNRPELIPDFDCEIGQIYIKSSESKKIIDSRSIDEAEDAFRRSIRESKRQNRQIAEAYLGLATILVQRNKISQAEKLFKRALDLMNPGEDFLGHLTFGEAYEKANLLSIAEDHYQQAIAIFRDNPIGHLSLASIYRKEALMDKARREYAAAREAAGVGYLELGNHCQNEEKWEDALECYHLGLEKDPVDRHFDLYLAAGTLHAIRNELEEAINDFQNGLLLNTERPEPYQALMQLFIMRNQYQHANRIHKQMAKQPNLAYDAHLSFGNILLENYRLKQAERAFRLAIQTEHQRIEGYIALGALLQKNNRLDEAVLLCQEMAEQPGLSYFAYISIGNLLFDQNEIPKAEEYYRKAITLKPDQVDAYLQLAEMYSQTEKYRDAKQALLEALAVAADDPQVNLSLAKVYERQRKFEESVQYYRKVAELETEEEAISTAYTSIGIIFIDQGRQREAVDLLEKALEIDPTNARACYFLGSAYESLNSYKEAEIYYNRATYIEPKNGDPYIALGRVYRKLRKSRKVERIEKKIMSLSLDEEELYLAGITIATSYAEAGKRKRAEAIYRDLIRIYPENQNAYTMLAQRLIDWKKYDQAVEIYQLMAAQPELSYDANVLMGDIQVSRGLCAEAERAYRQAIVNSPDILDAYKQLGQMFIDQNQVDKAIALMLEMSKRPNLALLGYINMGALLCDAQKYEDAENAFLDAIQQAPQEPDGYMQLAELYLTMGRNEDAERQIKKALVFGPEHLEANQLMAGILEKKGKFKDAIRFYQLMAKLDQDFESISRTYEHIGDLYKRLGNNRQAIKALNNAILENPSNADAYYSLGNTYEQLGEKGLEQAKEKYEQIIAIDPYYGYAYVALGRVYGKLTDIQGVHQLARKVDEMELPPEARYDGYLVIGAAYQEGNFPEWAIEEYNKAIALNPNRMEAHEKMGYILFLEQRWNSARQAYEKALEVALEPEKGRLHAAIGYCYFWETKDGPVEDTNRQDNEKKAEQAYRKAIQLDPNLESGYRGLAELYESQERWEDAIQVYTEMAAHVSELDSSAYLNIASIHRRLSRFEEMKQACQEAISSPIDPDSPEYFTKIRRKGLAHFMIAGYEQAEKCFSQVINNNAQDYQARFYHALNLLCLGNKEYAWNELETGIGMPRTEYDYRRAIEEASILAEQQPEIPGAKEMLTELIAARDRKRLVLTKE